MKKIFLLLLLLVITNYGQTNKITGNWLMTKAFSKEDSKNTFFIMNFKSNGKMEALEMEVGSWKYDKAKNSIIMTSKIDDDFNGDFKIIKLNNKELLLSKNDWQYYYKKIDTSKIFDNNKNSNLAGMWALPSEDKSISQTVKFELPDLFKYIEISDGSTETLSGSWIYNPEDKSLVILSMQQPLRGESIIQELTENKLVLENNKKIITAAKIKSDENKIERLTFEEDNLPEDNDVTSQLPWNDFDFMVSYLSDIKNVTYRYGTLNEETNKLHYVTLVSKIKTNEEKPSVNFVNLQITQNDTMQYSEKYKDDLSESYNYFFPETELAPCRVTSTKTVTVPAGTFECTVIEGIDGFDKVRYYMINDKPGIFAKIIREKIDPFDKLEYTIKELTNIN